MDTPTPEEARTWAEYDDAATWCAKRGLAGRPGDALPAGLSAACAALIDDDTDAFQERVRGTAYALACETREKAPPAGGDLTERERVKKAFRALRADGVFAKAGYKCCSSCAQAAIGGQVEKGRPVVYFHQQDAEAFRGQDLVRPLPIRYGSWECDTVDRLEDVAVGRRLALALVAQGLTVSWNGDPALVVYVVPDDEVAEHPWPAEAAE